MDAVPGVQCGQWNVHLEVLWPQDSDATLKLTASDIL